VCEEKSKESKFDFVLKEVLGLFYFKNMGKLLFIDKIRQ
jgi:hypothetical protein